MAATPPAPSGGSPFTPTRIRASARQTLQRLASQSKLSRSNLSPIRSLIATAGSKEHGTQFHYQQHPQIGIDSSDDEIFAPIKLSAYTKALLGDGPEVTDPTATTNRPATPPVRPPSKRITRHDALSPPALWPSGGRQAREAAVGTRETWETRGNARTCSAELQAPSPRSPALAAPQSCDNGSAAPRRVARTGDSLRHSLSTSTQRKTPGDRETSDDRNDAVAPSAPEPEQRHELQEKPSALIHTPIIPIRTVRLKTGSSGWKQRSGGSTSLASGKSSANTDHEIPEALAATGPIHTNTSQGSVPRYTAGRTEEVVPQSYMRTKRTTAKIQGAFLRGPARRGRPRQSEEHIDEKGDVEPIDSSQKPESQLQASGDPDLAGRHPPSSFASSYREPNFIRSGSPFSCRGTASAPRDTASILDPPISQLPTQSRDEQVCVSPRFPSANDKENGIAARAEMKVLPMMAREDFVKPSRPLSIDLKTAIARTSLGAVERKVLALKDQNTPRRLVPLPPPKMSIVETATATGGASATVRATRKRQIMLKVNDRLYRRIDCLGRGGFGKVYRVAAENGYMLALKRVSLENADENMVKALKGEIDLLGRLRGLERVIQLIDYELNTEKQLLSVLMEAGDLDFHALLKSRQNAPDGPQFDPVFIRHYWKEMLECVQQIHTREVVHSDLKPANFVMVKGSLKLIDFGTANMIQADITSNIYSETQTGTPSYMSPESLMDSSQYAFMLAHSGNPSAAPPPLRGGHRITKIGKPSDIWSLGCILYQMVYGISPFGRIAKMISRCQAIVNWSYDIDFPRTTEDGSLVPPSMIRTMKNCLNRDQRERPTCDDLLEETDPFLYPQEFKLPIAGDPHKVLPMTEELIGYVIQSVVQRCRHQFPTDAEAEFVWPGSYWAGLKKATAP
ncbi:kinase-like protein [Thozetella sp. PMI_491]|nr:kinase-like protein [Thozetella sp. PMI_491]